MTSFLISNVLLVGNVLQADFCGETRLFLTPLRDGGTRSQHGWLHNTFKILKKLHISMPHATPKAMTLGEYLDPDLEVSLIQQRERFKRSVTLVS